MGQRRRRNRPAASRATWTTSSTRSAWGLNRVFSNGVGYPRTSWLVHGGARDGCASRTTFGRVGADARLVFGDRPVDCAEHPAERAHPCRPARRRRDEVGPVAVAVRDVQGLLRSRVRRPESGRLPAARDRERGFCPALAVGHGRRAHELRHATGRPRAQPRLHELRSSAARAAGGDGADDVLERVRRRNDHGAPLAHSGRPQRERSRPLGVGSPAGPRIDVALLIYARDDAVLQRLEAEQIRGLARELTLRRLGTSDLDEFEPFGFRDGISQPFVEGLSKTGPAETTVRAGRLLGYPNEYDLYTGRPARSRLTRPRTAAPRPGGLRAPRPRAQRQLPRPPPVAARRLPGFWRFVDGVTRRPDGTSHPEARLRVASNGRPLAQRRAADAPRPKPTTRASGPRTISAITSSIRAEPAARSARTSSAPTRAIPSIPGRGAATTWRSTAAAASCDEGADGTSLTIEEAVAGGDTTERGLNFICLNANIQRQFEFISHTWLNNPKFGGLYDDADPVAAPSTPAGATFTIPTDGVRERVTGIPRFVSVQGGGILFLPGLAAVRYLAGMGSERGTPRSPVGSSW